MKKALLLIKFELKEAFSYAKFRYKDTITAILFLVFSVYVIYSALSTYIFNEEILTEIVNNVFSSSFGVRDSFILGLTYLFILALMGSILTGFVSLPRSLKFLEADTLVLRSSPASTENIFTAKFVRYIIKRGLYIVIVLVSVGLPFANFWGFNDIGLVLFSTNIILIGLILTIIEILTFFVTRIIYYKLFKNRKRKSLEIGIILILISIILLSLFEIQLTQSSLVLTYIAAQILYPTLFSDKLSQIAIIATLVLVSLIVIIFALITLQSARYYFSELEPFDEETELKWRNILPGFINRAIFNYSISKGLMLKDLIISLRTNLPRFFFFSIALLLLVFLTKPNQLISLQDIAKDISITYGLLMVVAFIVAIMPLQLVLIENDREMLWFIKTLPFESRIFFRAKHHFGFYLSVAMLTPIVAAIIVLHPTLRTILAILPSFLTLTYIYNVLVISDSIKFMPMEENRDFSIIAVLIVVMRFIIYSFPVLVLSFASTIFIPFQVLSLPLYTFYALIVRDISYKNAQEDMLAKEVLG
ncbi:MAG: hypothetical protein ACP6IS_01145 [Candidatus Asgardarchaeia archaeon]